MHVRRHLHSNDLEIVITLSHHLTSPPTLEMDVVRRLYLVLSCILTKTDALSVKHSSAQHLVKIITQLSTDINRGTPKRSATTTSNGLHAKRTLMFDQQSAQAVSTGPLDDKRKFFFAEKSIASSTNRQDDGVKGERCTCRYTLVRGGGGMGHGQAEKRCTLG